MALIKTKLGNSIAMPILIQGLQQFKSMSAEDKNALSTQIFTENVNKNSDAPLSHSEQANKIIHLQRELNLLKTELSSLKLQFNEFKQHLNDTKGNDN